MPKAKRKSSTRSRAPSIHGPSAPGAPAIPVQYAADAPLTAAPVPVADPVPAPPVPPATIVPALFNRYAGNVDLRRSVRTVRTDYYFSPCISSPNILWLPKLPSSSSSSSVPSTTPDPAPVQPPPVVKNIPGFECPVCFEELSTPILQCRHGHLLCRTCKDKMTTCPTCGVNLSPSIRNRALEEIIEAKKN